MNALGLSSARDFSNTEIVMKNVQNQHEKTLSMIISHLSWLIDVLKGKSDSQVIMNWILNQSVSEIMMRQLIEVPLILQKLFFKNMKMIRVNFSTDKSVQINTVAIEVADEYVMMRSKSLQETFLIASTSKTWVFIQSVSQKVLIDFRAEINVMILTVAEDLNLSICTVQNIQLVFFSRETKQFVKLCKKIKVDVDDVKSKHVFFMMNDEDHSLVLDRSFQMKIRLKMNE